MKKLVSVLYTASILLGSSCPMAMASAMQPQEPVEHVSRSVETLMSPYMPMTLAAPMSVAPVVIQYESPPMIQATANCPGGNCIVVDHSQEQATIVSTANGGVRGGATLPTVFPSIVHSLSSPSLATVHTGSSGLANTVATIVLRV